MRWYRRERKIGSLDERQERILAKVVDLYIESAEPVSSQRLGSRLGLGLSPATLRNEMAELEASGYLVQLHPSSGRVPTAQGFRYYLNHLLRVRALSAEAQAQVRAHFNLEAMSQSELLNETSRVLSLLSHYAGVVFGPVLERDTIRSLTFVPLRPERILTVLVTNSGRVEERVIPNRWGISAAELQRISNRLAPLAEGRTLLELRVELERQRAAEQAACDRLLVQALALSERLLEEESGLGWYIQGQSNILDQPEFSNIETVKELLRALEEKSLMLRLVDEAIQSQGPRVILGEERLLPGLKHLALVADRYGSQGTGLGCVGVLGPVRMNYARVIPLVKYTAGLISEFLHG